MSGVRGVAVLGSTGSIGRSTLDVIGAHPELFRVTSLGAWRSWETLVAQARRFRPETVILLDPGAADKAREALRVLLAARRQLGVAADDPDRIHPKGVVTVRFGPRQAISRSTAPNRRWL